MVKSSSKDLSEEEDVEDSKEKEDSGSDEDYEDPGFWSVIHGKEAYFLPREDGAAVLSTSDYTEYKSGASLSDLSYNGLKKSNSKKSSFVSQII